MSPPCKHRGCLLAGLLSCLIVCPSCIDGADLADANARPCRHLLSGDEHGHSEVPSFPDSLGDESAAAHVLETYQSQDTTLGVVEWLFTAMRDGTQAEASADDDEHAEHDHRRRLAAINSHDLSNEMPVAITPRRALSNAAAPAADADAGDVAGTGDAADEHAGETEEEHAAHADEEHTDADATADAHAGETEEEHAAHANEEVAGEEHVDENGATELSFSALSAAIATAPDDEARVASALQFVSACTLDPRCTLAPDADADDDGDVGSSGDLLGLKIGLAAAFLVMTVAATFLPAIAHSSRHFLGIMSVLNAFSGAVFLTVGLTHLLPEVIEYQAEALPSLDFPLGLALTVFGFLLILFIEQVVFDGHGAKTEDKARGRGAEYSLLDRTLTIGRQFQEPFLTEAALVVHAVLESIVLGITDTRSETLILFAAISLHKVFSAMSIATRFLRRGATPAQLFLFILPYHILPPLAIVLAAIVGSDAPTASLVLSGLAAGTFIYIGAFEVVTEEFASDAAPESPREVGGNDTDAADISYAGWKPSKAVKFGAFATGVGVLLGLLAAVPHDHAH